MPLSLHNLQPKKGSRKSRRRVGRGNASGSGNYSGRGMKGQKARSGASGLKLKGMKQNILNIPKLRGFKSTSPKARGINLDVLEKKFQNGETVSLKTLRSKDLISKSDSKVKILGEGEITKKLKIGEDILTSKTAKEKIEKAGGEAA